MRTIQFTKQGYDDLKKEHDMLQAQRVDAVKDLKYAREMGDLSENAAYKVARSRLSGIDARLRRLTAILKKVRVVEAPKDGYADIGSSVTFSDGTKETTVTLVDGYESDFMKGKISIYSPVGKALRGKRKDDPVKVATPGGVKEYRITGLS